MMQTLYELSVLADERIKDDHRKIASQQLVEAVQGQKFAGGLKHYFKDLFKRMPKQNTASEIPEYNNLKSIRA